MLEILIYSSTYDSNRHNCHLLFLFQIYFSIKHDILFSILCNENLDKKFKK